VGEITWGCGRGDIKEQHVGTETDVLLACTGAGTGTGALALPQSWVATG